MTIRELCEPLFLYVCRLNRAARKSGSIEYREARGQIEAILDDMRSRAAAVAGLSSEYEKLELALIFFVDSTMAESQLPFASEWHENRLAYDRNELAGDEKFFDILDETLRERGEAAAERIAVLYSCLGLGFEGWYAGQPEEINSRMLECSARLRKLMDKDDSARLCPEAYENVDTRTLIEPPGAKILGWGIALVGAILVLFAANWVLYSESRGDLTGALEDIRDPSQELEAGS